MTKKYAIVLGSIILCAVVSQFLYKSYAVQLEIKKQQAIITAEYLKEKNLIELKNEQLKTEQFNVIYNETLKQTNIDTCINSAENNYSINWEKFCKTINLPSDCELPIYKADALGKNRDDMREECFKRY